MFIPDTRHTVNSNAEVVEIIEKTIEWLNTLERNHSSKALVDAMPNDFGGRYSLQAAINHLTSEIK